MICNMTLKKFVPQQLQSVWISSNSLWTLKSASILCLRRSFTTKSDLKTEIEDGLDIADSMFSNSTTLQQKMQSPQSSTTINSNNNKVLTNKYKKNSQQKSTTSVPRIIDDIELGLKYHRLQLNDAILHELMTLVRSRKRRVQNAPIVIEGHRHIRDALRCQLHMETLLFSKREELQKLHPDIKNIQDTDGSLQVYKIPHHDLKIWSTLTTPPGVMAIFRRPGLMPLVSATTEAFPISVICDNIREPNNLGSIIRTCAALPCEQVILTPGCCDPWASKALRGGCGGHYRIPICDGVTWKELPQHFENCNDQNLCIFIADNNFVKMQEHKQHAIDYANLSRVAAHNIVIIGGESHGVSDDAYNFFNTMKKDFGSCLNIPVSRGIDSLNVASALTLIIYELRKMLITHNKTKYNF